jgi:hypothetical protein
MGRGRGGGNKKEEKEMERRREQRNEERKERMRESTWRGGEGKGGKIRKHGGEGKGDLLGGEGGGGNKKEEKEMERRREQRNEERKERMRESPAATFYPVEVCFCVNIQAYPPDSIRVQSFPRYFHSQAHNTVLNSLPILHPHPV